MARVKKTLTRAEAKKAREEREERKAERIRLQGIDQAHQEKTRATWSKQDWNLSQEGIGEDGNFR